MFFVKEEAELILCLLILAIIINVLLKTDSQDDHKERDMIVNFKLLQISEIKQFL